MIDFFKQNWRFLLELVLLAPLVWGTFHLFRATKAARIVFITILTLIALSILAEANDLRVLYWIIRNGSLAFILALVVIFQPELRRSFAELGSRLFEVNRYQPETLDILVNTAQELSQKRCGALFAIERRMDLDSHAETGVHINAAVSKELIISLFHPGAALHDGGMIIEEDRIHAAACVFPLSQREFSDRSMGLRHRAAIGLSEESDCLCIVVSEESGTISLALSGELHRGIEPEKLREQLSALLLSKEENAKETTSLEKS